MRKIMFSGLLIFSLTGLTGCFGFGDDEAAPADETTQTTKPSEVAYEGSDFSIIVNNNWEIIEPDSFTSNVPAETMVGFRNNVKSEVFTANLNIARFEVKEDINSQDLGKSTLAKAKQSLLSFQEISSENYSLEFGDETLDCIISDYQGKKAASEPIIHFRQLYVVNNSTAYIVTSAYLPSEQESTLTLLDEMLKSFRLK